jgi:hypothetical protein
MGKARAEGERNQAQNGYWYEKRNGKWVLVHHLIAVQNLGRPLLPNEGVYFKDGNRENLNPENIEVRAKGNGKARARLAAVQERIRELQAEERILLEQVERQS